MGKKLRKKRVLFPWATSRQGRLYKSMIAVIGDNLNWKKIFKQGTSIKKVHETLVLPKLEKYFPSIFLSISKYYSKHGRSITRNDFITLTYLRFTNVFIISKSSKSVLPTREHPNKCKCDKMKKSYRLAKKLYKADTDYDTYLTRKEK